MTDLAIRVAGAGDIGAIDRLLGRSYPTLLKRDYPPSVLVLALPAMTRAQPGLLASGTYYLAELGGVVVGAGGWTQQAPGGRPGQRGVGHVRHVATDPDHARRGIGRALMAHVMLTAKASGMASLDCLSTRTAVPFYASLGFVAVGERKVTFPGDIAFPVVAMTAQL